MVVEFAKAAAGRRATSGIKTLLTSGSLVVLIQFIFMPDFRCD